MRTGDTGRTKSLSARKEDKIMEKETKPMYTWFFLLSGGILVFIVYYYAYPMWVALGLSNWLTDNIVRNFYLSGSMAAQLPVRLACLFFVSLYAFVRSGSSKHTDWKLIVGLMVSGLALFLGAGIPG